MWSKKNLMIWIAIAIVILLVLFLWYRGIGRQELLTPTTAEIQASPEDQSIKSLKTENSEGQSLESNIIRPSARAENLVNEPSTSLSPTKPTSPSQSMAPPAFDEKTITCLKDNLSEGEIQELLSEAPPSESVQTTIRLCFSRPDEAHL